MKITRRFIDWQQPALVAVVNDLVAKTQVMGYCDLRDYTIVFPGSRAGRRFLELLAGKTQNRNAPPDVITVGDLPERLYRPQKPFADELTQRLAWKQALGHLPEELVKQVLPLPPVETDVEAWLAIGELLAKLHRELAAEHLRFSDVLERAREFPNFTEIPRWEALSQIQVEYLKILDALNLWDQQTARLVAIEQQECQTRKQIVLVGAVDMNQTLREMLDQVAGQVTVYVHAPSDLVRLFDSHGCLIPKAWTDRPIDLSPEQMILVEKPADQARAVARQLGALNGSRRVDEITIGVADDTLVPVTQRILSQASVPTRWIAGRLFRDTPLAHLLRDLVDYLEERRTSQFAALVRHPDLSAWLVHQGADPNWLTALDRYVSEHLPASLGHWLGQEKWYDSVKRGYELVEASLAPLLGEARYAGQWHAPLVQWLLGIYGHREFDPELPADAAALAACQHFHEALKSLANLPESLTPAVNAVQALRLALDQVERKLIPPAPNDDAIELLGWLELPLDDAQELIIAGFNEGAVPSSMNADLFLPNSLRSQLKVTDNARRLARDVYALSAVLASRRSVTMIGGNVNTRNDAIRPSRLWFATDPETIARRVERFYGDGPTEEVVPSKPIPQSRADMVPQPSEHEHYRLDEEEPAPPPPSRLIVPRPLSSKQFAGSIPVTGFSDYIASPYRFYLRHVLKLTPLDDEVQELDARDFGNLLHNVLKQFGRSGLRNSIDEKAIADFLDQQLELAANDVYGGEALFPVQIQIEQARDRLRAFAKWQAARALQGWDIVYTEHECEIELHLDDGRTAKVLGKIDRIDRHRGEKTWAILDYKTGEQAKSPRETHVRSGEWVDLQLPLYRLLAEPHGIRGDVQLGYITIPRDNDRLDCRPTEWGLEELREAEAVARRVAKQILNGEFWKELDRPTTSHPEFGPICQDGVLDREVLV
jgi:ATP-dependent helicase/nuclease subunit B